MDEKKQKAEETGEGEAEEDASESYDFGGRRILLAEDTEMNAEIVTELLELVNMHVDHAWNGEEAVERYMESAPGTYMAVLMDVQKMCIRDREEPDLLHRSRQQDRCRHQRCTG